MSVDLIPLWSKSMDGPYDFVYTVKVTLHSTHRLTFHKKFFKKQKPVGAYDCLTYYAYYICKDSQSGS